MTIEQLFGNDTSDVDEANFERVFGGLHEGPFEGIANECEVIESAPPAMTVEVRTGTLVTGGVFGRVTAQHVLAIAAADAVNDRIDRVVARRDNATNLWSLAILTGVPAGVPVAPALTRNGTYEISLAQVLVQALVVAINTADITDERSDYSVCGYALGKATVPVERTRYVWLPPEVWKNIAGIATPAYNDHGAWAVGTSSWDFDGAATEGIAAKVALPSDWKSGTVLFTFYFQGTGADVNNRVFDLDVAALTPDVDNVNKAVDVAQSLTVPHGNGIYTSAIFATGLTVAEGDTIRISLARDPTDGADTNPNDASFFGMRLEYTAEY